MQLSDGGKSVWIAVKRNVSFHSVYQPCAKMLGVSPSVQPSTLFRNKCSAGWPTAGTLTSTSEKADPRLINLQLFS